MQVQGRAARAPFSWVNILNSRLLGGPCAPGNPVCVLLGCHMSSAGASWQQGPRSRQRFAAPLRHRSRLQAGPAHPLLLGVAAVQGRAGSAHQPLRAGRAQPGAAYLQGSVPLAESVGTQCCGSAAKKLGSPCM